MGEACPEILRVALLGTPAIQWAGKTPKIPRRQVRALLYRLAVEDKPTSRTCLCDLFWSDLPENAARQNLSRLLVYLAAALPGLPLIEADDLQVQLNPDIVQVDTRTFSQLWHHWLATESARPLQQAVRLYRGSFLGGFYLPGNRAFENWSQEQAAFWEARYLQARSILLEEAAGRGDFPAAIEHANQILALNNLAEEVHLRLMELYAACGDWPAALRQFESCATILERELGLRPSPPTQAAYQAVLAAQLPGELAVPESPAWVVLPGLAAPLIGRQVHLETLEAHLGRARSGRGGAVLIHGEPGIGKSRLMQEFTGRSRLHTRVLVGSGLRECYTIPYQPLIQAIRPMLVSGDLLSRIPPAWLAEAGRLFPELAELTELPQHPPALNPEIARSRLFEALLRMLAGYTTGGYTLILCLDDLQWADTTTLDWLVYAASRLKSERILLLGSYRSDEIGHLGSWQASWQRLENVHELHLSGLDSAEISQLAGNLPEALRVKPEQAAALCDLTGGNPFFLLEILRMVQESGIDRLTELDFARLPIPDTVQKAVGARLQNLRPQVRQTLEAASILGSRFTFQQLLLTSGRQELEILDGLDELLVRQFLVERPEGHEFYHAIIREAVYASLSQWRRKKLNQRAGYALEKLHDENWSQLAWFFEQAGLPDRAAQYALRAGKAAQEVFAHQEARAYFDHALELLRQEQHALNEPEANHANWRQQIELLYERGWALRLLGNMQAYTQDLEEVAELAGKLDDAHALAHLRWQQAYNHRWFCRYEEAQGAAGDGLRLCRQCGSTRLEALCRRELGLAARETGGYESAALQLQAALKLFEQLSSETRYTVHTLGNLSTLYLRAGSLQQAEDYAHRALEICAQNGLDYERRLPLGDLGAAAAATGDYPGARKMLHESLEIARQIADCTQEIFCLGQLGWLHLKTGQLATARRLLQSALERAHKIDSRSEQSWLHLGLAQCYAALGDRTAAWEHAAQAVQLAEDLGRLPDRWAAADFLAGLRTPG